MPKLVLFVPCERVIVEEARNTVSLIALMQDLTAGVPDGPIPDDAVAALRWYVLAVWNSDSGDAPGQLEQSVTLDGPTGKTHLELRTIFEMTKPTQRNIGLLVGFPIAHAGSYTLRLRLRRVGVEAWTEIATYPIGMFHVKADKFTFF